MATDCIRREAAIRSIADYDDWFIDEETGEWVIKMEKAEELLEAIPAADVRPVVRGTWLFDRGDVCKCSNCGWETSVRKAMRINFCPNCGADMRGK